MDFNAMQEKDLQYMNAALSEAAKALAVDEVPIGCVIVHEGKIIGRGHNLRNTKGNALCHAEMMAIDQACRHMGDWRLEETTLYVTVEPCPMCAGAIVTARIPRVVFGASNKKAGCCGSILNILQEPRFNHQVAITKGVLLGECAALMSGFFKKMRNG